MHHMIPSRSSVIGCRVHGWSLKISAGRESANHGSGEREPNMLHLELSNYVDPIYHSYKLCLITP